MRLTDMQMTPFARAKLDMMGAVSDIAIKHNLPVEHVIHMLLGIVSDKTFDLMVEADEELGLIKAENAK